MNRGQARALERIVEILGDTNRANELYGWCNAVRREFAEASISDSLVEREFGEHFQAFYKDVERLRATAATLRAWTQRVLAEDAVADSEG